jgi:diamine N-acetyltransferase
MSYFTGKHIKLRAPEPSDIDFLYSVENDESLWEVSDTLQPYSKEVLRKYLEQVHQDIYSAKQLKLIIQTNEERIGMIDIFDFDPFHLRAGIGVVILKEFRQNGYAKEALEMVKQYCFGYLNINMLYAQIAEGNNASLQLFESHGFAITGYKKQWLKSERGYKDVHFLQCFNPHNNES